MADSGSTIIFAHGRWRKTICNLLVYQFELVSSLSCDRFESVEMKYLHMNLVKRNLTN